MSTSGPLLRKVDSVQIPVPDLDEGIPVGRLAVVADPFGNPLVLPDLSKGTFITDDDGNVTRVG